MEEREILENYFKHGHLLVIVCTSTLSSGINFPARRVIIRTPMFNGRPIDAMNYKQMAGRAGRKGIDTCGESILMCSNLNEKKIADTLVNCSKLPELTFNSSSSTELSSSVKRALLETIVSGIATKRGELCQYVSCFLSTKLDDTFDKYIKWLNTNQFIDVVKSAETSDEHSAEIGYKPTQLAYAVVQSAMAPDEGLVIFCELQKALQCFVLENELHIIYQITPINICDYWMNSSVSVDWNFYFTVLQNFTPDMKRVGDLVGVRQSFILKMIKGQSVQCCDQKLLKIHLRFYTCLILHDLVNEVPFGAVLNKYACQKGFLQTLQQSASTYASMITVFCNRLGWFNLELLVNQFQSRLMFGVQRQLVDLVRVKLLNSHRARLFYNAGYTTVASLAMCEIKKIEKILRTAVMFVGTKKATTTESGEMARVENSDCNNSEVVIWHDGKGYTYWQASSAILKEANELLKADLEQLGVKVSLEKETNSSDGAAAAATRTQFQFNDSVDSILLTQKRASQSQKARVELIPEAPKTPKLSNILVYFNWV
jgi:DNA polymerase theta